MADGLKLFSGTAQFRPSSFDPLSVSVLVLYFRSFCSRDEHGLRG